MPGVLYCFQSAVPAMFGIIHLKLNKIGGPDHTCTLFCYEQCSPESEPKLADGTPRMMHGLSVNGIS